MKITFLGTGNAFAPQRDWGCILVNDAILLDAGPSMLVNLNRLQLDATAIRHIFISHFHGDHFFGLPFFLLNHYFVARTSEPLAIIGPPGVEQRVHDLMALAYPDIFVMRGWPRPLQFVEVMPGSMQEIDGVQFTAIPVVHGNEKIKSFGYRLLLDDGILAYTGDTTLTDTLDDLFADARVAIMEADSHEESPVHLGRRDLQILLARMPESCQVFLNHLDTRSSDPWKDLPVTVPDDLASFTIS